MKISLTGFRRNIMLIIDRNPFASFLYNQSEVRILVDGRQPFQSHTCDIELPPVKKKFWPCAPDGFIPNSIVRIFVAPRAQRNPPIVQANEKWRPRDVLESPVEELSSTTLHDDGN